jgi:alpha-L-fucosidase
MMMWLPVVRVLASLLVFFTLTCSAWEASWESLDKRPLPGWYDEAKFGIFIHWGVFSVPSYGSEWFWSYWRDCWSKENCKDYQDFVNKTEGPNFDYPEYAHRFKAELYNPEYFADVFSRSGAQYVVLTSKHHEGFCNWDSRSVATTWNWNAMDIGPRRDILGDLALAVKNVSSSQTQNRLKFGVYHSLYEWFNPMYQQDKASNWTKQNFVDMKTMPELYDLVEKYEPEIIWSDGEWEAPSEYWKSTEFLAWYATNSSVAETGVFNDRWGQDTLCKHGGVRTCTDRYQPGAIQNHKWENALTVDSTSWGWNRNATYSDYLSTEYFVHQLIETVAFNGNMLLNVGPGADGTLSPIFVDRLLGIGDWLTVNGEAIYKSRPWDVCQNETQSDVYYTTNKESETLYAHFLKWPSGSLLRLEFPQATSETQVRMLGFGGQEDSIQWNVLEEEEEEEEGENLQAGFTVQLPALTPATIPCKHAWVLAISNIGNFQPDEPPIEDEDLLDSVRTE